MKHAKPLPRELADRYTKWKTTGYTEKEGLYKTLAREGQEPRALVISCCDSRVTISSIFNTGPGELFTHRNIANMVPPYAPEADIQGTGAAIEYAVTALKVPHIIVVGHSLCGGVKACDDMCAKGGDIKETSEFVGRWITMLEPTFAKVAHIEDDAERATTLEKENIKLSLSNLMSFPFVRDAVQSGAVQMHGLWTDISSGDLEYYDAKTGAFEPV
ncbi:MAG: carbonic anhydrase [Halocynthiibacter sp.]